jgi:pyruvyl transferase EpsO
MEPEENNHAGLMRSLANRHGVLAALIGAAPIHYVDVPMHGNIGDLLIMLGTLRFFSRSRLNVKLKTAYFTYRANWARPGDVIVFQGGGNLGDLYPEPQETRQRVIRQLDGNRVVILPQTIHFRSRSGYDACCSAFSRHPDLHICVRDRVSYELALPMSRHVYLLPDMAHQLWPIQRSRPSDSGRRLALVRADQETAGCEVIDYDARTDWRQLIGRRHAWFRNMRRALLALHLMRLDRFIRPHEQEIWIAYATKLVREAVDYFSRFDAITTDRLHAHILACLMQIPNTAWNNSYGKNHSYVAAWTGTSDIVSLGGAGCLNEKTRMQP